MDYVRKENFLAIRQPRLFLRPFRKAPKRNPFCNAWGQSSQSASSQSYPEPKPPAWISSWRRQPTSTFHLGSLGLFRPARQSNLPESPWSWMRGRVVRQSERIDSRGQLQSLDESVRTDSTMGWRTTHGHKVRQGNRSSPFHV